MSSRKRAREDEADIQIRVAGEPVPAQSFLLRTLSSCARALPADAAEWDVSGLLHDGQTFSRETVSCWLQCGYRHIYGAAAELGADSISQLSTVTGLTQVLAFAHAVGSFEGMLQAACSQLQQLKLIVQLPEQVLELPLAGGYTYWFEDKQLAKFNLQEHVDTGAPLASDRQWLTVQQQVTTQLSALLQLAHVLHLQPLLDVLHQFLLLNVWEGASRLLSGIGGLVFTDAVLEAALGSSSLSKEAYISSVLSQPCSLTSGKVGYSSLLKPVGPRAYDASKDFLYFDAQLLRDFAGGRAGDTVNVTLDLFDHTESEGRIQLRLAGASSSFVVLPAQLLLGYSFPDAAALKAFLEPGAAE